MEEAALTTAHTHARNAATETSKSNLAVAATEHQAAADDFGKAQAATSDPEALRMLKLLQEHHRQLAHVITSRDTVTKAIQDAQEPAPASTTATTTTTTTTTTSTTPATSSTPVAPASTTTSTARVHPPRREASSALAKDMATRRGIPPANTQRKIQPVSVIHEPPQDRRPPPMVNAQSRQKQESDDAFSRFYQNWTTGPFSRLSSMLAFTALPLTEQAQPDSPTSSRHEKTSARATNDPDVKSLISPAALDALSRHGHVGPSESFYIIPTSGGTASYANILSQRQSSRRHLSNITEDDAEFVDAQETQHTKHLNNRGNISVREEELQLENDAIKRTLDQLSHRLQAFEAHAQDASMAALTQSMASVRSNNTSTSSAPPKQHEDDLQAAINEINRLKHDNARYKSYYAKLKDSARAKVEEKKRSGAAG